MHRWTPEQWAAVTAALRSNYALEAAGIVSRTTAYHQARELVFFSAEGGDPRKYDAARPHSAEALRLRASAEPAVFKRAVRVDHAIPWRTIREGMRATAIAGPRPLQAFLSQHLHSVVITKAEDDALREKGLRQSMPEGVKADDPGARYRAAGIRLHRSR